MSYFLATKMLMILHRSLSSIPRDIKLIRNAQKMVRADRSTSSILFKKSSAVFLTSPNYHCLIEPGNFSKNKSIDEWTLMVHKQKPVHELAKSLALKLKEIKSIADHQALITSLSRVKDENSALKLVQILDDFSIKRISSLELQSGLKLCFSWFETGVILKKKDNKNWINFAQFPRIFCKSCIWTKRSTLEMLNPGEFLLVMLLSSLYQDKEMLIKPSSSYDGFSLPAHLEDKCLEMWPFWSMLEKGILAEVLYMMNVSLSLENPNLAEKFVQELQTVPANLNLGILSPVPALAKIISKQVSSTSNADMTLVSTKCDEGMLEKMNFQDKIRLLKMISQVPPLDFAEVMLKFTSSITKQELSSIKRLKDLELLAASLFHLNCNDKCGILNDILEAIKECPKHDPRSGRSLIFLLKFLAGCGVTEDKLVNRIFKSANHSQALINSHDEEEIFHAGLNFLFNLFSRKGDVPEETMARINVKDRLNVNAVRSVAELDFMIEMDFPNYQGERLDQSIRSKLLKLTAGPSKITESRQFLHEQLEHILGVGSVYIGPILPHFPLLTVVAFCLDKENKTKAAKIPLQEDVFKCDAIVQAPVISDHQWYCIVLPSPKQLLQAENEVQHSGLLRQQIRHLSLMGFNTIVLYPGVLKEWKNQGKLTLSGYFSLFKYLKK